ncbi:hypothetical protein GGI18_002162 [Coemansia linderi]|uniref:Uncharacterized protein n=1 Tax=Coemansia linderi TaxID=2663919 RepID=A0ACC1KH28_9FUNG|nr:hypothetical protein GGI18_002162 [Coemansia linderi]
MSGSGFSVNSLLNQPHSSSAAEVPAETPGATTEPAPFSIKGWRPPPLSAIGSIGGIGSIGPIGPMGTPSTPSAIGTPSAAGTPSDYASSSPLARIGGGAAFAPGGGHMQQAHFLQGARHGPLQHYHQARQYANGAACQRCHTKKIKCEGDGAVCDGCRQAGSECRWVEMKKRGPKPKPKPKKGAAAPGEAGAAAPGEAGAAAPEEKRAAAAAPPDPAGDSMDDVLRRFASAEVASDTREAVECFFDFFYGRMPLFHPASFVRRVVAGAVDPLLLDTMKACTARIVAQRTGRTIDVDALGSSVRRRLLAGLDRPTDDYVRAVVVAAALAGGEAKFMSYNSLTCLASSLVTRLGWHTLDLGRPPVASWDQWVRDEERRRTFWAVYQLDCYQALMADRPTTVDASRLFIAAPAADCAWDDVTAPRLDAWGAKHAPPPPPPDAALSYAFVALSSLAQIMARISAFTWDVRVALAAPHPHPRSDIRFLAPPRQPQPPRRDPVATLFDYPEFARLHAALKEWVRALVPPESMRDARPTAFACFGGPASRRFAMRVRYFCLRCYHTAALLLLHLSNRPSFFAPASRSAHSSVSEPSPELSPEPSPSPARSEAPEDATIRAMLGSSFAGLLNDGLLAHDVVPHSWDICLREIDELIAHLDRNADVPMDRCDASISFCLFVPITVLVRQIRSCRERAVSAQTAEAEAAELRQEMTRRTLDHAQGPGLYLGRGAHGGPAAVDAGR